MTDMTSNRRDFLKLAAVGVAVAAGTRMIRPGPAQASDRSPAGERQWAMVIDQSKCTGCGYCTLACRAKNDVSPDVSWNKVEESGQVGDHITYIARPCMQCAKAPCVEVCPVEASYYRDDGIVMMDYDRCIGCRYCQVACPYQARSFNWEAFDGPNPAVPEWGQPEVDRRPRGVVEKCSFCYQRIDRGLELGLTPGLDADATPACCVVCPTGARIFGDLNDPESNVSLALRNNASFRLREDLGTGPRVYYLSADVEEMEV
jgi:Fe-S-cluster-containing dehydrogenase component